MGRRRANPNAFLAARAARCAEDQGKFWEYHDILFRNQTRWSGSQSPTGVFEDYAGEIGADRDTFSACLRSDLHADVVTANLKLADQLQVRSTPTILITRGQGMARDVDPSIAAIREAIGLMP